MPPSGPRQATIVYLYVCLQCGWWTTSDGVDEVFGSLVRPPGPRTEPCERCQHTPMYLVKQDDLLSVVSESEKGESIVKLPCQFVQGSLQ